MVKRVILVHGWGGTLHYDGWFGWLKEHLEKQGFEILGWSMPNPDWPRIGEWVNFLKEHVKDPDEETFFVGHSIGCQTIIRYLESLPEEIKVGGALFVGGWFNLKEETYEEDQDKEIAKPWLENPINFDKVKTHTSNFTAIFSDDDPYVPLSNKDLFEENLGAKTIVESNKAHFEEVLEFPNALNALLEMSK